MLVASYLAGATGARRPGRPSHGCRAGPRQP